MQQLHRIAILVLIFATTSPDLFAQATAIFTTDKESYSYGDTMQICRSIKNDSPSEVYVEEDGCCSDEIFINGVRFQQYYATSPISHLGECVENFEGWCHLGFVGYFIQPGEQHAKDCIDLPLVNQTLCTPDWDGFGYAETFDFEVTDPMRIQVGIESVGLSQEIFIPVNLFLPVELEDWKAELHDSSVFLSWSTLSERDNAYFEIEMSEGGEYQVVGNVGGNGSTVEKNSYTLDIPLLGSGSYMFRLSQIDFDGTRRNLGEVELFVPLSGEFEISSPYPNPSSNVFNLDFKVKTTQHVDVVLYDLFGRTVGTLYSAQTRANESVHISSSSLDLANGSYVYRVKGERFEEDGILTVQR